MIAFKNILLAVCLLMPVMPSRAMDCSQAYAYLASGAAVFVCSLTCAVLTCCPRKTYPVPPKKPTIQHITYGTVPNPRKVEIV